MNRQLRVGPCFRRLAAVAAALFTALALVVKQPVQPVRARPAPLAADPAALERHVRFLAIDCVPRDLRARENLEKAADYIAARFRGSGGRVREQVYPVGKTTARNLSVEFGPIDGPRILVGAHYDADGGMPGADDNASGSAVLMELARLFAANPPKRRTELVAWTLEEPPWFRSASMGSRVHAAALKKSGEPVRAVIGLEMLGFYSDAPRSQHYPLAILGLLYPSRGNFLAVVGRLGDIPLTREVKRGLRATAGLPVRSLNGPTGPTNIDLSDHASYWAEGYSAVMVTDTAFFRNPRYHEPGDTPETLDYVRMARAAEMIHGAVAGME